MIITVLGVFLIIKSDHHSSLYVFFVVIVIGYLIYDSITAPKSNSK
ncbi:hypothetical protein V8V80_16730 [Niallia taxi]